MGKKVKPKSLLEGSTIYIDSSANNEVSVNDEQSPDISITSTNSFMTPSDVDKLEKYDAMEKNMSDLIAENTELKEKLEEYMMNAKDSENESGHEVGNIHEDAEEVNELKAKIAALHKQLDVEKTRAASKIIKLEDEIKALRDENDNYLMKISEITFDNARMTAELNELTKSVQEKTDLVMNQPKFTPNNNKPMVDNSSLGTPYRNPYNPYANNGYGTW